MNHAALFIRRVLAAQVSIGLAALGAMIGLTPLLLLFEQRVQSRVFDVGVPLGLLGVAAGCLLSWLKLRKHRFTLRTLALGSDAVEPEDLGQLARLPRALTARLLITMSLFASLIVVPGVRPDMLDDGRAVSLLVLGFTILGAAAVPLYATVRAQTSRLFELAPLDPLSALLAAMEERRAPELRVERRLLFAVVLPAILVGVGAVLVIHAHLRTFVEESRKTTALAVARSALDAGPEALGAGVGRAAAIEASLPYGYTARFHDVGAEEKGTETFTREADGRLLATVPLEDGKASLLFSASLDPLSLAGGAGLALLFVLVAAALGHRMGRALTDDLARATMRVRTLGTESVILGEARVIGPTRFRVVRELEQAIDNLADRFRVFAAAQERALEARETAQRMKGLLFASVSHDLKSPLNAILGFAHLVEREELTTPQRESLEMISTRGRELLALIETILDAARVEAGQLELESRPTHLGWLIDRAVETARALAAVDGEIFVEVDQQIPPLPVDPNYITRAIAVIVAHGLRTGASDRGPAVVHVRASLPTGDNRVRIDIELGSRTVTADELRRLFARQATDRGRGLTLGLSLSRAVFELHAGAIEVEGGAGAAPRVHCWLPLMPPPKGSIRRRLSSYPALG